MGADNTHLSCLMCADTAIDGSLNFLGRRFEFFAQEGSYVKGGIRFKQSGGNGRGSLAEDIREHIIQFDIGNCKTVLGTVLFPGGETCEFGAVAHQISELTDVGGRDKAAGDKTVLENIGNPLGILLVGLLATDGLDILGM